MPAKTKPVTRAALYREAATAELRREGQMIPLPEPAPETCPNCGAVLLELYPGSGATCPNGCGGER